MKKYLNKVRRLIKKFSEAHFIQVPREENLEVDTLAKEASVSELTDEFDEAQYMPSIDIPKVQQIGGEENWMTPIISYLKEGKLPQGRDEACKLRIKSAKYVLMDEVLYKRGFSFIFFLFPYLCRFLFLFFLFFLLSLTFKTQKHQSKNSINTIAITSTTTPLQSIDLRQPRSTITSTPSTLIFVNPQN